MLFASFYSMSGRRSFQCVYPTKMSTELPTMNTLFPFEVGPRMSVQEVKERSSKEIVEREMLASM